MFEKLCDNLNLLMAEARINANELGRRTGLPASTIKKIRNRDNPNPTLSTLLPIAQHFTITLSQLVGDEPLPSTRLKGSYQITNDEILRNIPIIPWTAVIAWPTGNDNSYPTITTEHEYNENAFALIVEEEDWENLAKDTVLLIDPVVKPEHRDYIVVSKRGQGPPTIKQLLIDEEQMFLKSVVLGHNIIPLTEEHKILGVVVEYKKQLKKMVNPEAEQTTS